MWEVASLPAGDSLHMLSGTGCQAGQGPEAPRARRGEAPGQSWEGGGSVQPPADLQGVCFCQGGLSLITKQRGTALCSRQLPGGQGGRMTAHRCCAAAAAPG